MIKRIIITFCLFISSYLAYIAVSLTGLPPVSELKERKLTREIQVRDWHGEYHPFLLGPKNRDWTPSNSIPSEMKWAVILAEDANFYKHEGVDVKAIKKAIKHDLEKKSLARGASTITQQTAKNIYLSREKTVSRKVKELYLALRMEQELTKGRIIELYLNVVELGPMVYGVGHASRYYFGKPASEMTPRECAFLAAMLPGPRVAYNPYRNMSKVLRRSDLILKLLNSNRVLSEEEYAAAIATAPNITGLQKKVEASIVKEEIFTNQSSSVAPASKPAKTGDGEVAKDSPSSKPTEKNEDENAVKK
ncbi:MAG: monofunctional biosynthetic peptidoglycan transglycosylase [Geobacteraceae bacterium]|nr:monofunctional biosynthetic peptidoglycan transglycosylase [Geobacteraceae bacterium]